MLLGPELLYELLELLDLALLALPLPLLAVALLGLEAEVLVVVAGVVLDLAVLDL